MRVADRIKVGILVFNEVEVLDFAGPFEVFSLAALPGRENPFEVYVISETGEMIRARNGLMVKPHFSFYNTPKLDILIVPGGYGAEEIELHNEKLIEWIRWQAGTVSLLASVCTGAFLLAEAGLLDGRKATTHWLDIDRLEREYPRIHACRSEKYVDEGSVMTSGGISAGIDMSFYIIKKMLGDDISRVTARRMEYAVEI